MTTAHLIIALESISAVFFLWGFVCIFWRDYCLDEYRQNIFELRDSLFTFAAENNITFQHPGYRLLRERMNSCIRYGHEFTLIRFVFAMRLFPHDTEAADWQSATRGLSKETREALTEYRNAFAFQTLRFIILRSFLLAILVVCGRAIHSVKETFKRKTTAKVVAAFERLEIETVEESHRDQHEHDPVLARA